MLLLILCLILASMHDNDCTTASTRRVDDVILKFVVDATPLLFPPSRVSLRACISYDDAIDLSRRMSNHHLAHSIRNSLEEFDQRIYDNLEHQNLYMLDLDCEYAIEILRQAHSKRMFVAPTRWLLLQDRRTVIDNASRLSTYDDSVLEVFENLAVYPDSDVILAGRFDGDFLQLSSVYRPSPQRGVIWENRGNWTAASGLQMRTFDVASARRRNLQRTLLKSCIVMINPDTINHLTDFEDKHIDSITKANYAWILHLANRMNATISFEVVNSWGYSDKNGSWNGMTGMLVRREIDIGGTGSFLTANRMDVVQYIQLYTRTGTCIVFRRPLLSTVKNIFILPFQRNVWIAIGVFLLLVFCLLHLSTKWERYRGISNKSASYWKQTNPDESTVSNNMLILLGAFTQQGYSYEPYRASSRIITFMLLTASLSLYASYTANIVTLLQSTTDSIKTLSDILHSPLTIGSHDTVYNQYFLKSYQDPVRKAIYEQKIEPKGRKHNWMTLEEGVRRVRNEPFAFHGPRGPMYQLMQDTYQEQEKCGVTEMDYMNSMYPLLMIQKQSPYSELIKNGALKLREYGLKYREEYRLYAEKPVCSSQTGFITIGFTECYFTIVTMGYGVLLSVIVFALELLWYKKRSKDTARETIPATMQKKDPERSLEYVD